MYAEIKIKFLPFLFSEYFTLCPLTAARWRCCTNTLFSFSHPKVFEPTFAITDNERPISGLKNYFKIHFLRNINMFLEYRTCYVGM